MDKWVLYKEKYCPQSKGLVHEMSGIVRTLLPTHITPQWGEEQEWDMWLDWPAYWHW